jgi:hypothetical protein
MFFWKTKQLRNELITDSISEKEKMKYLLATMTLFAVSEQLGGSDFSGGYFLAETLSIIFVTIIGILVCFDANSQGDGNNFIERFICISWPITIKITTFIMIFLVLMLLLLGKDVDFSEASKGSAIDIFILIIFEVVYFWRIKVHLAFIAKGDNS